MAMVAAFGLRVEREIGMDRDLAFALVAERISEAERAFGSSTDGALLERYALEAVIDLLSRPTTVRDVQPESAEGDAC